MVALRGAKKIHFRNSGNRLRLTILACSNAAGNVIPPSMVIFEGKSLNPECTKGGSIRDNIWYVRKGQDIYGVV